MFCTRHYHNIFQEGSLNLNCILFDLTSIFDFCIHILFQAYRNPCHLCIQMCMFRLAGRFCLHCHIRSHCSQELSFLLSSKMACSMSIHCRMFRLCIVQESMTAFLQACSHLSRMNASLSMFLSDFCLHKRSMMCNSIIPGIRIPGLL